MLTSPAMRIGCLGVALALSFCPGCYQATTPAEGRVPAEAPARAAPEDPDASLAPLPESDAGAAAPVDPGAGGLPPPLPEGAGCYGRTLEIASGEGGRFSIWSAAVVGHRDGWLVLYRTATGSRVALVGGDGTEVLGDAELGGANYLGPETQTFVRGSRLVVVSRRGIRRIDFGYDALARVYEPLQIGSFVPSTLDADPFEEHFRVVTRVVSRVAADGLLLAELAFDASTATGFSVATGSLSQVASELAYDNPAQLDDGSLRLFLAEDRLFAFLNNPRQPGWWRALDIQLGLDVLGRVPEPLGYRVLDVSTWSDGPLELAHRHVSGRYIGLDGAGMPASRARAYELGDARGRAPSLVEAFGAYSDDDRHALLADAYGEVHFFRGRDFSEAAAPIALGGRAVLGRSWPPNGFFAAAVDLERDDGTSAIGLRCFRF